MKKIFLLILTACMLASCAPAQTFEDNGKLNVCASFYAMYDFARAIGGDDVNLYNMTSFGSDPHDYEPTAADMARLSDADVFIYHGGIDGWAEEIIGTLPDSVHIVHAPALISSYYPDDPHTWLSPVNAELELEAICMALASADSANAEKYRARKNDFSARLSALDADYKNAGFGGKTLFVSHGAYRYLCEELGMEQFALDSITGESDPSPAQMAELVKAIDERGAKCIFYDPLDTSKLADAAAAETGIRTEPLSTFENDSENKDYVTVMRENLERLKTAFN